MPRRRLRDIRPTGALQTLRVFWFLIAIGLAVTTVIALPFAGHVHYGEEHHVLSEITILPELVAIAIGVGLWWAFRGGLVRTVIVTPLVAIAGFVCGAWMALQHLMSQPTMNAAEVTSLIGFVVQMWVALLMFLVEWLVVILERRKLERADPQFPTARVVQ